MRRETRHRAYLARLALVAFLSGGIAAALSTEPSLPPPEPARPAPAPEITGPVPVVPEGGAARSVPVRSWWNHAAMPHLRRVRVVGKLTGPVGELEIESRYLLPEGNSVSGDELRTPVWTFPHRFWVDRGAGWEGAGVRAELSAGAGEGKPVDGPALVWREEGRMQVRLPPVPRDGASVGIRVAYDFLLAATPDGWTTLAFSTGDLATARLDVEILLSPRSRVLEWDLPPALRAVKAAGDRWLIRGRRERALGGDGLRLRWRTRSPGTHRVPEGARRVTVRPLPLSEELGLVTLHGRFAGRTAFPLQVLAPRPSSVSAEELSTRAADFLVRRFGPRGEPEAPLEVVLMPGQGPLPEEREGALARLSLAGHALGLAYTPEPRPAPPTPPPARRTWTPDRTVRERCFENQRTLEAAVLALNRARGMQLPVRWPSGEPGWDRWTVPHLLHVPDDSRTIGTHRHVFRRRLESGRGGWTSFAFLGPRLEEAGFLASSPGDPGYGAGSLGHYVLLGLGQVLCLRHGYHALPSSPLRRWGGPDMPVREQLERLGVHDAGLFALADSFLPAGHAP